MLTSCIVSKWDNKTAKHQTENIQEEAIFIKFNRKFLEQTYGKAKFAKLSREYNQFKSKI